MGSDYLFSLGVMGPPISARRCSENGGSMTTENNHKVIKKLKSSNLKIGYCSL